MSDSVTLLPPNATELERALARCAARVSGLGVTAKMLALWNPETCPAATLPWLAQALHVDEWSETWTEAQKRAVIAASVATHKRKGTIGALKRALAALGYEVVVDEDTGIPFTFRLAFNLNQTGPLTGDTYAAARRVALANKNARSHLLAVRSTLTGEAGLHIGVAHYRAQTVTADAGTYLVPLVAIAREIGNTFDGLPMTLVCHTNGATEFQWYFDGEEIDGATSSTYTKTADSSDAGDYYCVAWNDTNTATSNTVTVELKTVEPAYWWVNSTTGITETDGKVSQWLSKYGDGKGFEQSNADYRPALYPDGAINGITPVRFTLDSLGPKAGMSDLTSSACSVSALFTLNAYGGTNECVVRIGNIGFALRYITTNGLHLLVTQYTENTGYVVSVGQTCLITATLSAVGGTPKIYVNKQLAYTGTWYAGASSESTLGSGESQVYPAYDISMFEAIAWDKELTQENIDTLVDYVNAKYNLNLA